MTSPHPSALLFVPYATDRSFAWHDGAIYGALAAALAHERACYEALLDERPAAVVNRDRSRRRWEDATALVAELRAAIAGIEPD